MNRITLFSLCLLCLQPGNSQGGLPAVYRFTIDLLTVKDDVVHVELAPPAIDENEIIYYMPKIVPGTYSEDDFGRFISDFEATDKQGNRMKAEKIDLNGWKISNAQQLRKISYKVRDSFDDYGDSKKVFEPCGSNIQQDTNYLINNHCFAGYFEGMKEIPFQVTILHPNNLYGSTPLTDTDPRPGSDNFVAENYNSLVDNPIMYCIPDTTTVTVGNSAVLISVYSPNRKVSASILSARIARLLQAQGDYLGGNLPVKKYAFLIYLSDKNGLSGGQGALEHSYSSVYFMPEGTDEGTMQAFLDVAAHEFFHVLTPLNIHSQEIRFFDFNHPKMSKHLWLYEGTTEYHAHLAQEKSGLISRDDFLQAMQQKISSSTQLYNDSLPFTEMSEHVLDRYADQFGNVYQKGALIALCMDIKLRQLSGGNYGILDLIFGLSKKYGKDNAFSDDALFAEIGKMTYPEIEQFLNEYVAGKAPLPLETILAEAGVDYTPVLETGDSLFTLGGFPLGLTENKDRLTIISVAKLNDFGRAMGYQLNDVLISINGQPVTPVGINTLISNIYKAAKPGDPLTVVVRRRNAADQDEELTLSAPMVKLAVRKLNVLSFKLNPSLSQKNLQDSWLNK